MPHYDDYRVQLVASDVVALGVVVGAAVWTDGPSEILALSALGVYALGAPTIHVAHGQTARGGASLGLRVAIPVVGGAVGILAATPICAAMEGSDDGWGCLGAMAVFGGLGVIGGGVTAIVIDDGFLGKAPVEEPAPEQALRGGQSVRATLVPLVDPIRKTYGASLVGTF